MVMMNVGFIAADTIRSRAYLQRMIANNLIPEEIIIIGNESDFRRYARESLLKLNPRFDLKKYFAPFQSLFITLREAGIDYNRLDTDDINSQEAIQNIKRAGCDYFIYSGRGGAILREEVLDSGPRFIHIHGGRVPDYRGSTTIYYTLLNENKCHASAFFLDKKIDTGELIKVKEFPKPEHGELIDFIYDPHIRADLLIDILKEYKKTGKFESNPQPKENSETYHIIHPVLKHIGIMGV